jgi:hypothetical protein
MLVRPSILTRTCFMLSLTIMYAHIEKRNGKGVTDFFSLLLGAEKKTEER